MIRHYLQIFSKVFRKSLTSNLISVIGLGVGIGIMLLSWLYLKNECNVNTFFKDYHLIYRLKVRIKSPEGDYNVGLFSPNISEAFKNEILNVNHSCVFRSDWTWITHESSSFNTSISAADSSFFQVFSYQFLAGDNKTCLNDISSIALHIKTARKLFGEDLRPSEMIGKIIHWEHGSGNLNVTGIFDDQGAHTTLGNGKLQAVIPFANASELDYSENDFGRNTIFIKLNDNSALEHSEYLMTKIVNRIKTGQLQWRRQNGLLSKKEDAVVAFLSNIQTGYYSEDWNAYETQGSKIQVYIMVSSGVLILLIALINFLMLGTALDANRLRELINRKRMGARPFDVFLQCVIESLLTICLSVVISAVVFALLLPSMSWLVNKSHLTLEVWTLVDYIIFFSFLTGLVWIRAAITCLLYVSISTSKSQRMLRVSNLTSFVIPQFIISIMIISIMIAVDRQLSYVLNKDTGIETDQRFLIRIPNDKTPKDSKNFKNQLFKVKEIEQLSVSDRSFQNNSSAITVFRPNQTNFSCRVIKIDADYVSMVGLNILKGDDLNQGRKNVVLVNETFVKEMGLDQTVDHTIETSAFDGVHPTIVGVVKDFYYDSFDKKIAPLMLLSEGMWGDYFRFIFIRTKRPDEVRKQIAKIWQDIFPDRPFQFRPLQNNIQSNYSELKKLTQLSYFAGLLSILLACSGLYALVLLVINKKVKEIGVRKSIGSSKTGVVMVLLKKYFLWITFAFIIAVPLSYILLSKWLNTFAYHIELKWWFFMTSGLITTTIALLTVGYQTCKAANVDPVKSLRYE